MAFEGTAVAMVTPFKEDGTIDEEGYRQNISWLIDQDVDGLVAAGTTGESATLSHEEHRKVLDIMIDEADGRVATIAGTGSNATSEALELTKYADDAGADMALLITPYYNKPQQHGVIEHYTQIANSVDIDLIAYNVPSRTSLDMAPETIVELAKVDNIAALKEASSDVDKVSKTMKLLRENGLEDDIVILSGSDELTLPLMSIGARGVISASANIDPRTMVQMVNNILDGNYDKALELHYKQYDLIKALFIETSPAPAKEALKMMGMPAGPLRLPLVPMLEENRAILKKALEDAEII
ncbi:4-hydroxy-tetrahydrodipicolinate synthase [uncultured Methanobrevibacter sp.]|uniref:4-hydroxy-tetrahydrodipicolinate synthase n=1 Tax=uncultured Methanobrevibacter sp. TaxID=253161 RepID=UPI00262D0963